VIRRFIDTYVEGGTPNPCIDCNRYIKFDALQQRMRELDFDYVVTGHYANIDFDPQSGRFLLKKGLDSTKDQSYVLYHLTQEQLAHTLFPLGNLPKTQVRELAEQHGFGNALKQDSQDICFVPDGDYGSFIEGYTGKQFPTGDFVDQTGKTLGTHQGFIRYTVGQRKGLGISAPEPLYVCGKNAGQNTVTIGTKEQLFTDSLVARDINLISVASIEQPQRVKAKIRYRQQEQPATVTQTGPDELLVVFDEPQRAISPGQSVVLYDGDVVVGGGIIQ
jgi:tRNA-specific 2-thiouridylase